MKNELVSIIMTTYNVEKHVNRAIDSILTQTHENLELIIIDDCSTDNTIQIIQAYNDPRIKLYKNTQNAGSYFCKNYGITQSKGTYITLQDSDDYSTKTRIEEQLNYLDKNPEAVIVKCQYVRVTPKGKVLSEPKAAFPGSLIRKRVFEEIGFYDTVRVAADDEFDCRAKQYYGRSKVCIYPKLMYYGLQRDDSLTGTIKIGGSERVDYVKNFSEWHNNNKDSVEGLYMPFPHVDRMFHAHEKIQVSNKILDADRFLRIKTDAELVTASLATFPKREEQFKKVVDTILPQVDQLIVYLNEYLEIPDFLNDPKIVTYLGNDHAGNIADNGKFYNLQSVKGFHFTIDDDICYPDNYIAKLLEKLEEYNYSVVVGVHGIDINYHTFTNYYEEDSRNVYTYRHKLKNNRQVHIAGTGTTAYHSSILQVNFAEIIKPFMVDIFFAIQVNRQNIPIICIERPNGWLVDYDTDEETKIYNNFRANDEYQSNMVLEYVFNKPKIKNSKEIKSVPAPKHLKEKVKDLESRNDLLIDQLNQTKSNAKTLQNSNTNLRKQIKVLNEEKAWYARTYDHLPKSYLKAGGIFRRVKIKKGF